MVAKQQVLGNNSILFQVSKGFAVSKICLHLIKHSDTANPLLYSDTKELLEFVFCFFPVLLFLFFVVGSPTSVTEISISETNLYPGTVFLSSISS